ncbi:MAG: PIN domain-containing protein [Armatimonadetes bacterium]|nr:PIN domain-containing protein [Armatimonadota bacterium]
MKKQRVYIDTSVIGGCFDNEFAVESVALFDMARNGEVVLVVSDVLVAEIESAPERVKELYASLPPDTVEKVNADDESDRLRQAYIAAGVVGPARYDDALHVATATASGSDLIVSWNFKHIVHYDKIRGYNAVNIREGYHTIAIYSPKEVVSND